MIKRFLDKLKASVTPAASRGRYVPYMPEVETTIDVEFIFSEARKAAAGEGESLPGIPGRSVVIVTPGRMIAFGPCSEPGSMSVEMMRVVSSLFPPPARRNIAVIAYNGADAIAAGAAALSQAIPFLGFLVGFADAGHTVWIFEGHDSALAAGCRDADALFVDSGMLPFLRTDWAEIVRGVMRTPDIFIHNRENYSLLKLDKAS